MSLDENRIRAELETIIDPNTDKDFVSGKAVRQIKIDGNQASVDIELGYPAQSQFELIRSLITEKLERIEGIGKVSVNVSAKIIARAVQPGVKLIPGVKNIIAIASGKGGVGKSTTAANLALALAAEGARVGMLDADIYGPSQPFMLGLEGQPELINEKYLRPMMAYGIQAMSIGLLVDQETPMIWRGPMAVSALQQLLHQTAWDELDYLVVDLPPGTGDIQLTLAQQVPVTGAVIVTTPQDIALLDARKGLRMFEKVSVPILGVIENMSTHICSQCGHEEPVFGSGGGERMARDYQIKLLGQLPLDLNIRLQTDSGKPTVVADPDGRISAIYKRIARRIAARIAGRAKDMSSKFPEIVVQR